MKRVITLLLALVIVLGCTTSAFATQKPFPFTDVKENDYYYKPVYWAYYQKITNGTDSTHFSPNSFCTRGQIVTFLWNMSGKEFIPNVDGMNAIIKPFADVQNESEYYFKPVIWASGRNITNGTSKTMFSPEQYCTRAQIITFLWRYYHINEDSMISKPTQTGFEDVPTQTWYTKPVMWAVQNGITHGITKTQFHPNEICTRAQAVTFMYRAQQVFGSAPIYSSY